MTLYAVWRKAEVTVQIVRTGGTGSSATYTEAVTGADITISGLNRNFATGTVSVYVDGVQLAANQYTRGGSWYQGYYLTIYASALPGEEISE